MLLVLDDVVARELRMFHLHHLTLIVGNLFLRFFKCHTAPLLDVLPQDMPFRTA